MINLIRSLDAILGICPFCGHEENEDPSSDEEENDHYSLLSTPLFVKLWG
jgi:hypothetical protein